MQISKDIRRLCGPWNDEERRFKRPEDFTKGGIMFSRSRTTYIEANI